MPRRSDEDRAAIVAQTIRVIADTVWASDEKLGNEFYEVAKQIEKSGPADWWCCPLCEEATCDEGCPLKPLRDHG